MFRRVMPGSGIATEAGIVTLRFYAAHSTAGSQPVTLPGCMSDVDVETVPQCPHAPQHAKIRRGVSLIHYRTDFLDLQAFDLWNDFFVQRLTLCRTLRT